MKITNPCEVKRSIIINVALNETTTEYGQYENGKNEERDDPLGSALAS